uniref:AB hydrolase-1 domain-containing protein n=1 Tax=Timema cristinae TaxID=61476 RepID=A0A7R9H9W6_TIMCR|nr:unnamed protein product [Timema cristinae]
MTCDLHFLPLPVDTPPRFNYRRADWPRFQDRLARAIFPAAPIPDVAELDRQAHLFASNLLLAATSSIPARRPPLLGPPLPPFILDEMRLRDRERALWQRSHILRAREIYRVLRSRCRRLLRRWRAEAQRRRLQDLDTEDLSLWRHLKGMRRRPDLIPELRVAGGLASAASDRAEALAVAFEASFARRPGSPARDPEPPGLDHPFLPPVEGAPPYPDLRLVTPRELSRALARLKTSRIRGLAVRFFTQAQASSNMIVRGIGDYDAPGHPYRQIRDGVVNPQVDDGSTPGQNSNLDLPDICSPVYCENSSLDHVHPEEGYTGYILADAGFDVWLGNYRGNSYSNQHISLDTDSADYWDFSWHENGFYDLPAMIDHIRSQTGQDKIYYIGHSMGTTGFYVMGSMRPEYNDKIRAMFSLAPIAYMSHMTSPFLQLISKYITELQILRGLIGLNEFSPNSEFLAEAGQLTCSDEAPTQSVCGNVVFLFTGFDSQQLNEIVKWSIFFQTMLPVILGHTPAGASTRQIIHYGQEVKSGYFRQYDHGSVENLLKYGSLNPPDYDLSKVTAPVSLHYSNNDWLASLTDVDELYSELPNVIGKFLVPLDQFNHIDYMWAIDAKTLVYDTVISIMSQY